ncbi:HRDC-like protein [Thelonectria olida]|uniref:DNA-directed RNA polymerase III subunit RPC9 n=1 Tax=Thelonectria olida TaxID=1576542 RepID=A0A9P9AX36_9HYPO|nr:HRDC-like protein [Thelonectria olida]
MKIVESQAAVLTNFEVYQHISEQRDRYKKNKRRGPPIWRRSFESQEPVSYTEGCITKLLERLRPYHLAKGEVVMILNLRPASVAALNTVIEEMSERFNEEQQEDMVTIISEVLGQFPPPADAPDEAAEAGADVSMNDATAA